MNKHSPEDFQQIESLTLEYYENNADAFWSGTRNHDVDQNYSAFLDALPPDKLLDILDFGCGPGRDLLYFKSLGHRPVGLDGSMTFSNMARKYSGCDVLHQTFLNLNLPCQGFDGVFANASLFHVPSTKLHQVLTELHRSLRNNGILFMSNPRGSGEGWNGPRFGHYMEMDVCRQYLTEAGFEVKDYYYRPTGMPHKQQPWLAVVSQRINPV